MNYWSRAILSDVKRLRVTRLQGLAVRRWVWTVSLAFSLAIWIGSAAWALHWVAPNRLTAVWLAEGGIEFGTYRSGHFSVGGFSFGRASGEFGWWFDWWQSGTFRYYFIPTWLFVLASLAGAAGAWWKYLCRWRRKRRGHCIYCGYHRIGLDPRAKCPECGETADPGYSRDPAEAESRLSQ